MILALPWGKGATHGWIIDAYGDYDRDSMVLWLWNERGARRIEDPRVIPSFFLHAPPSELPAIRRRIEILDGVRAVREVSRRIALEDDEPKPVLEIVPRHYRDLQGLAHILDSNGGYVDHRLFNVDLRLSQRYAMEHDIFPMGLVRYGNGTWTAEEEHFALEYPLPPLRKSLLDVHVDNPAGIPRMQDKLLGARLDDIEIDGDAETILRGIGEAVRSKDPDVLMTDGGDAFTMPYLARKAAELGVDLQLGRDPDKFAERKGKSYFTYGKIVYKPGQYILRGRLHLDRGHFAYRESDFAGLAELSRLSTLTPQEQARLTPGTAFSAMQVNLAYHDGCLVIWKKNRPEEFKDAENLLRGDRGGFTFEPEVGLHEGLYELDFSSLYPSIMVKYNISAETLDCACCTTDGLSVPELRYHLCTRRVGIVGRVLKPLIERRRYYKKMKKEPGPLQDVYAGRDTILKWTLVTCLDGRTVIPYKMGDERYQKPISEIIDPLLPAGGMADAPAELRLFGFDPDLRLMEKKVSKVLKVRSPPTMLRIGLRKGRDIVVTPNHRFFVLNEEGGFDIRRADGLHVGDYLPTATNLPKSPQRIRSVNLAIELSQKLTGDELFTWRIRGEALRKAISLHYKSIMKAGLTRGFTYRTIWLWRERGMLPLAFLPLLQLSDELADELEIGRTRLNGGKINFLPCQVEVDRDLGFFLGFYAGDGNGRTNMVRFAVGMTESEILGKLMNCADRKFGQLGSVRKEKHARMWVLQFNSGALRRILESVFGMGGSADSGKLVVPSIVLNGGLDIQFGFVEGLLASDGSIAPSRDWALIHTANRGFADMIGLLLAGLGLKYVTRHSRQSSQVLYSVGFRLRELPEKFWMKIRHQERAKRYATRDLNRAGKIPVLESGLLAVCEKHKVTHSLPKGPHHFASAEDILLRIQRIRKKQRRISESDRRTIQKLEHLARSELTFLCVRDIEKAVPQTEFVYCFEMEEELNGFVTQGNLFVSNSFGYQGYKNARFGRIECHEAINAFARNILVRTMEVAESHGYEVVHGIVDSVWLRAKPGADPIDKVREHIAGSIGLPIELEGHYKWIVFLPCKTTGVGALNRYYGLFNHDEFKLRGIELRKHDTPEFINICQEAMLGELSLASNAAEFRERIPKAVDILRWTAKCVLDRTIPVHQFILTKNISRALPEYVVLTATAAALKQMEKRGFAVEPGESIRYVLLDARARDSERKVRVAEFLEGDEKPDAWEYIRLLCRSGQTLLAPFGYTEEQLTQMCEDLSDVSIANIPEQAIAIQEDYKSIGESRSRARGGVGYKKPWRIETEDEMHDEIPTDP
ncbi:MAG TPA: DNA polymerase domain-containing protein [Thermoplasmata archaeon]|nr:DNA polymerase domain-containing protein [Thermoplasmata archaeon]